MSKRVRNSKITTTTTTITTNVITESSSKQVKNSKNSTPKKTQLESQSSLRSKKSLNSQRSIQKSIEPEVQPTEIDIKHRSLNTHLSRPEFTKDELEQIEADFKRFDILGIGKVKPSIILTFVDKNPDFVKKNPFYYHALKNLNTLENNKYGITIDDWIKGIKKVIMEYNTEGFDSNWDEVYHLIVEEGKNKTITQETLLKLIRKLGFEISEDAVKNIVEEIGELDQNKFKEIILDVEMNSSKRNI